MNRRITRRQALTALGVAGAGLMASACIPAGTPAPQGAAPSAATGKKVRVTLWRTPFPEPAADGPAEDKIWQTAQTEWWEKKLPTLISKDIDLQIEVIPTGDVYTKLSAAYKVGNGPDVALLIQAVTAELMTQGVLLPLPKGLVDVEKEFGKQLAYQYLWDGNYYTLPLQLWGRSMYYNEAILKAHGYVVKDIPNRWDDLVKFAQSMTKRDSGGAITQNGIAVSGGAAFDYYTTLVDNLGGYWFRDKKTTGFDTPEWEEAFRFTKGLVTDYKLDDLKGAPATDRFFAGKCALLQQQYWVLATARHSYVALKDVVGAVPAPTFNGGPPRGWIEASNSYAVPSQSKDPDVIAAAWDVWKALTVSEQPTFNAWWYNILPARLQTQQQKPAWAGDHWWTADDRYWGAGVRKITTPGEGVNPGFYPAPIGGALYAGWDDVYLNDAPPKQALAKAAQGANTFLSSSKGAQLTVLSKADYAAHPELSNGKLPIKPWWDGRPFKPSV